MAVIADDGSSRPVIDFQADVGGNGSIGVSDRKISCAKSWALSSLDRWGSDHRVGMIGGGFFDLEAFEHLAFGFSAGGGASPSAVAIDEVLKLFSLGCDRGVGSLVVLAETLLVFEVFVYFSWEEGQFAHGKIEGRVASRVEEGSVVGDDQAGFLERTQKVF